MRQHADIDEPFSERERAALALWRAPEPPADFAAVVLRRRDDDLGRGSKGTATVAVAALALLIAGGVVTAGLLSTGAAPALAPGRASGGARIMPADGGPTAEVMPETDGLRS